jgi:flavin reductase (DIM6/NTAB) family NADH-FMN oxidoreductase RutF
MKIAPGDIDLKASHELLHSAVVPRPIAFVSTVSADGIFNIAPFSSYSPICVKPMLIGFGVSTKRDGQKKDTLANIEFSKDFVINVVTEDLAVPMNQSSYPYPGHISEFKEAGLTPIKADIVTSPMVAESPINMECRMQQILEFGGGARRAYFIIGEIVMVHVWDALYINGEIQMSALKAIARLGGQVYCRTGDLFIMENPQPFT